MTKLRPDTDFEHFGRQRHRSGQVHAWQERRRAYRWLRPRILEALLETGWDQERIKTWFNTPNPILRNKPPKHYLHPKRILTFYKRLGGLLLAEKLKTQPEPSNAV